jgi:toxin ParE1/3/4
MAEPERPALWSPEALADLDQIWDYYAGVAGPNVADNVLREIGRVAAVIEDHPLAGRARDEIRLGLRSLAANPHVAFYRVVNGRPEIIRVLDGRRDIDEIFTDSGTINPPE